MGFYKSFIDGLKSTYGQGRRFQNEAEMARFVGVEPAQIFKYTKEISTKNIQKLGEILDRLGAELVFPVEKSSESVKDVCFVEAKVVPAGENSVRPQSEDYMAVPMVEEVGAGPGVIPQEQLLSWFLVYKHQDAVRYRRDLIAVQLSQNSTSMMPTLNPKDIVLIDRQDRNVQKPGHMMLVMDPHGGGKIKRVAVEERKNDFRITYYSDNAAHNPPEVYSLREDFMNDWDMAIVGRVVWAWSDVSNK